MAKTYTLSKKRVREIITQKFGEDTNKSVKLGDVLALFESAERTTKSSLVINDKGEVVGKHDSYFDVYLPIEYFGTIGKDKDGNPKYNYWSKVAAKCKRIQDNKVKELTNKLLSTNDMKEFEAIKKEIEKAKTTKCPLPQELAQVAAKTPEELLKKLSK